MKHLDDFTLNEYLDRALSPTARDAAEAHMQTCITCRTKMDELKAVFSELEALPDVRLERDLMPTILARLSQIMSIRVWTRTFAAQVGVVLGLVSWLSMQIVPYVRLPQVQQELQSINFQSLLTHLLSIRFELPSFHLPVLSYQLPPFEIQLPTIGINISTTHMALIAISTLFLWIVGNVILLQSKQEVRK